jgi:AGCS family alanine or glycine:cation symporter
MAIIYVTACLAVIIGNITVVPAAFGEIFQGAFAPDAALGGVLGVLIVGFQRAAFSNEAGIGSAAIAHSAVRTKEPATEGHVALLEPFIDTIVICTMTALTIVISGAWDDPDASELGGVSLTSRAFESVLPWFPTVLAVAVVLFAFSTMISWSYYGMKATRYLAGDSATAESAFKIVFCVFVVIGAALALGPVIGISDSMIFLMAIPNVLGLYLLARVIRREIGQYREKLRNGEIVRVK